METNFKELNERFDRRYMRLIHANGKVLYLDIPDNSDQVAGILVPVTFPRKIFVSNCEIMYKPLEAFDFRIRTILKE